MRFHIHVYKQLKAYLNYECRNSIIQSHIIELYIRYLIIQEGINYVPH